MAITYGFFDSNNHDRQYNAEQFGSIFDGIIRDGVYSGYLNRFTVRASTGMNVTVDTGRAWYNHTWILNDSIYTLEIPAAEALYSRIDAVVIEINKSSAIRANSIKIVRGTPASNPSNPTLTKSDSQKIWQYPLAYIRVNPSATTIAQSNITNAVGTAANPYVTGIIESYTTTQLTLQWSAQWSEWFLNKKKESETSVDDAIKQLNQEIDQQKKELQSYTNSQEQQFNGWFQGLKDTLNSNAVANLTQQINDQNEKEFKHYYGIDQTTTNITKSGTTTQILQTSSEAKITTAINKSSDTVTNITTSVVPNSGSFNYTKTTKITKNQDGSTVITESYSKVGK